MFVKTIITLIAVLVLLYFFSGIDEESSHIERGLRWSQRGNYEMAIKAYTKALEVNPSNSYVYNLRGLAKKNIMKFDEALADFSTAISIDENNVEAYINHGSLLKKRGEISKALTDYNSVIKFAPKNEQAYIVRADLWFRGGCFGNAIADYNFIIDMNPSSSFAYMGKADSYYQKREYEEAIKNYKKAIELNPEYSYAYNNLAWILSTCTDERFRNGKLAIEFAKKAVKLNYTPVNLHTYAAAFAENGMFEDAINALKKVTPTDDVTRLDIEASLRSFKEKQPLRESPRLVDHSTSEEGFCMSKF